MCPLKSPCSMQPDECWSNLSLRRPHTESVIPICPPASTAWWCNQPGRNRQCPGLSTDKCVCTSRSGAIVATLCFGGGMYQSFLTFRIKFSVFWACPTSLGRRVACCRGSLRSVLVAALRARPYAPAPEGAALTPAHAGLKYKTHIINDLEKRIEKVSIFFLKDVQFSNC